MCHTVIIWILLSFNVNLEFGYSKEPSQLDGSVEYQQHMLWMRTKTTFGLTVHYFLYMGESFQDYF